MDIIYLSISSKLSGGFRTFNIIKNLLKTDYPDRKIEGIDLKCPSAGIQSLSLNIIEYSKNHSFDEIISYGKNLVQKCRWYCFSDNMACWNFNGRFYTKKSIDDSLKPVLKVMPDGTISPIYFYLNTEDAIKFLKTELKNYQLDKVSTLCINYTCYTNSSILLLVKDMIRDVFPDIKVTTWISDGPLITAVSGPNTVEISFIEK